MAKYYLNWMIREILDERGLKRAQVATEAGLHPDIVGQMYANKASRVSLKSLARLCTLLGIGVAPPPPEDAAPNVAQHRSETLLTWQDGELRWRYHELRTREEREIRDDFFVVAVERTTLDRLDTNVARQASLVTLGRIATAYGVGLAEKVGNVPALEYILQWDKPRVALPDPPPQDETPIPDEPSKVCHGPVCILINPSGVEKRLSAFPKSARYRHGVGPLCKRCRQHQEKERRRKRREVEAES